METSRNPRGRSASDSDRRPVRSALAEAVGTQLSVLFDSGIRTGRDAFKALALGADAVLICRHYVYGLALGGSAGTMHVTRMLLAEFKQTLASAGYATHATSVALR